MKAIDNFEIIDLMKNVKGFKGCFYKDQLPTKLNIGESIIINLDSSDGLGGTHWVALYNDKHDYCYFDSFGVYPPNEVVKLCNKKKILFNNSQFQNNSSVLCGYYCLYFLKEIVKIGYYDLLYRMDLKNTVDNEHFLNTYFKKQ